jgi:hypothetical protein
MRNKKWNEYNKKREQGFSLALSFIALLRARIIWVGSNNARLTARPHTLGAPSFAFFAKGGKA